MEGERTTMATDYDSPRKTDDDLTEDSLQELQARRMDQSSNTVDIDPDEAAEGLELPGADLSGEELAIRVIPRQADEFTCSRCFLVHHRSQLAEERGGQLVCRECAAWPMEVFFDALKVGFLIDVNGEVQCAPNRNPVPNDIGVFVWRYSLDLAPRAEVEIPAE